MNSPPILWFVIPCYNEGSAGDYCIRKTAPAFIAEMVSLISSGSCSSDSRICYVDDGSSDDTWDVIKQLSVEDPLIVGVRLSRNQGHQNALLAGLMEARRHCDIAISMDCDGQDDPRAIKEMVDAYYGGFDVAYGVRSSRATDSPFKRLTAEGFYKLMNAMGAEVVFNHADYRMLSKRALDGLSEFGESNLFLRGLIPMIGYPSTTIEYERAERSAGKSHYPLSKMLALALNGITSLSTKPIRIVSGLGISFSLIGLFGIGWAIVSMLLGYAVAGWASTICIICLIGGLQFLCLGVIGEYIGKVYLEVKHRPRYIIAEKTIDEP